MLPASPPAPERSASRQERRLQFSRGAMLAGALAVVGLSTSGQSRLGVLVLFVVATVVALDAVLATQATARAVLAASVHPLDVVVGDRFSITVTVSGTRMPLVLYTTSVTVSVEPPGRGDLEGAAQSRGVVRSLLLSTASSGLCGLVTCARNHYMPLARPLEVGPRPVMPSQAIPEVGGGWGEGSVGPAPDSELVRGVRDYLPGDRLRQVHWRATARHGDLIVKETEEPQAPALHLVLDMGAGGEAGEAAAGRAAWYAGEALRRGYRLTLTTVEDAHPLTDGAPSMLIVNRRLARAGVGPSPRPAEVERGLRVLMVTDEGDSWL